MTWNGPTGGSACLVDRGDSRLRCDGGRLLVGHRLPFWLGRLSVFLCELRHCPDAGQRQGPITVAAACTVSREGTASGLRRRVQVFSYTLGSKSSPCWVVALNRPVHQRAGAGSRSKATRVAGCWVPWDTLWLGAGPPRGYGHLWMGTGVTVWEPVAARRRSGRTGLKKKCLTGPNQGGAPGPTSRCPSSPGL